MFKVGDRCIAQSGSDNINQRYSLQADFTWKDIGSGVWHDVMVVLVDSDIVWFEILDGPLDDIKYYVYPTLGGELHVPGMENWMGYPVLEKYRHTDLFGKCCCGAEKAAKSAGRVANKYDHAFYCDAYKNGID